MAAISPTKSNFWPRPRDANMDTLLRPVVEVAGDSIITCMASFNGRIYFAGQHPTGPTNAPRLYMWDPNTGNTAVALPAAFAAVGNTQITGMVVFNNQLWIVSGNSAVAGDNGQIWVLNPDNTWAAGPAPFGFPGWTGGAAANMVPRIFLFGGNLAVGAFPAGGAAFDLHTYTGAAWALEVTALVAADMDTLVPVETAAGALYFGVGQAVWQRNAAGVYAQIMQFPLANDIVGIVEVNGQIWAAQAPGAAVPLMGQAFPVANQSLRVLPGGVRFMFTVPSGLSGAANSEVVIVTLATGEIMLFEEQDRSLRTMVRSEDDGGSQIISFQGRYYVAQGSVDLSALAANAIVSARISVFE